MPDERKNDAAASRMMRNAGKLSALTMISRVLGLIREMTKAALLGTGSLSDSFAVSFVIPNFMRRLFAEGSVTVAFIPTFKGYLHANDDKATKEFLSATLTVLTLLVGCVVAVGIALAPWIVKAFGSDPAETIILTRIMFPFLALVSVAALLQGILNSIGVFTPSGMAPILFNLCFIVIPWLIGGISGNPARAMAVSVLVGGFVQAACQVPSVIRAGYRFGFIPLGRAFANPGMRKVMALVAPTIVGMAAYQINDIVSTALASRAGTGVASSLQYSLRLQELILGVFAVAASTVLLPELADAARKLDWDIFSRRLGHAMESMVLATVPVAVFSIIAGSDIVTLLFKARQFGDDSVRMTTSVFFWHQTGLLFIALNRVIAPAFYARSDTRTPTYAGIISFVVNILVAFLLVGVLKGPGLAIALSVASLANTAMLSWSLLRSGVRGLKTAFGRTFAYSGRILLLSLAAGIPVFLLRPHLLPVFASSPSRLIYAGMPFLVETCLFLSLMAGALFLARDPVAGEIWNAVARRRKRG
jgi:putative peptidoglycan lipid II flippase